MKTETKNSFKISILLAIVTWISYFLYFKRFGLYEDDYSNIAVCLNLSIDSLLKFIAYRSTAWIQGHPLLFLTGILTYIGEKIGGLNGLYIVSFFIILINCYLVYRVLKIIFPDSELFAVTGSLCFCLFPSDTTKIFLTHAYFLQISLMFFLAATLLYLKSWIKTSYLIIILCILSYESPFMVFFGIPLLKGKWNKKFRNEMFRHVFVLTLIVLVAFILRKYMGEARVEDVSNDLIGTLYKIVASLFIGPLMNLFLFVRAPIIAVHDWINLYNPFWSDNIIVISVFCLVIFIWFLSKLKTNKHETNNVKADIIISEKKQKEIISERNHSEIFLSRLKQIFLVSIVLLMLAYAVSFTHYPPTTIMGRYTSVHLAASFAGSIIFGCLCTSIMYKTNGYIFNKIIIVIISSYLTLLVGYQLRIQIDFIKSWSYQKSYWSKMIELIPDLKDNTKVISILPSEQYTSTMYIYSFSGFSDKNMLKSLFRFPNQWREPPSYKTIVDDCNEKIEEKNGQWMLKDPYFPPEVLQDSNVILIVSNEKNEFVRIDSSLTINGKKLNLKPKGESTLDNFEKTPLYDLMILP